MTSPLNDLTHRLTLLAAPYGYQVTVRLLGGPRGAAIELRAAGTRGVETQEYTRQLTLRTLEKRGAAVAADFIREARVALSAAPAEETVTRARLRRARR